jgi:hypothetical protein
VFYELFSKPDVFKELYSAIGGVSIPPGTPMKDNTLSNALFMGQMNDVAFTIDDRLVVLIEHQSTLNHNMPLRLLMYIGRVYEQIIDFEKIYHQKQIKIPTPEFIVLYNGTEPCPDHMEVKLSEAFRDIAGLEKPKDSRMPLELTVQIYNINHGCNSLILEKCKTLDSYSFLVNKVREYEKEMPLAKALETAIQYCIDHDFLKDYLTNRGSEVINMLFGEYNFDRALEVRYEEGQEDGITQGITQERAEIARNALKEGSTVEFVQKITGLSREEIEKL